MALLVLLLFLFAFSFKPVSADARGQLLLRVECYRHPSNMRVTKTNVTPCDSDGDCDPEFRFCLSSRPSSAYNCELERLDPFQFEDSSLLGECAEPPPAKNFPPVIKMNVKSMASQLYLTVDLADVDISFMATRTFEIDHLRFNLFPGLTAIPDHQTPSDSNYSLLNISARSFHGSQQPQLSLLGLLQCAPNRYGAQCESFCEPTIHYRCNAQGDRVCKPGWRGENCSLPDPCSRSPCKSWAMCTPLNGTSFECECDGRTGQQCVVGTDPCLNHRCLNGASCVGIDTRPVCYCPAGWKGKFCDLRDPCSPNPCQPNGECSIITKNGSEERMQCLCYTGYDGPFCEIFVTTTAAEDEEFSTQHPQTEDDTDDSISAILLFSILFVFIAVGIAAIFFFRRYRQLTKAQSSELSLQASVSRNTRSSTVYDEVNSGTSYDQPEQVYLPVNPNPDTADDYEEILPAPNGCPPPLPERRISENSQSSADRRYVKFIRPDNQRV